MRRTGNASSTDRRARAVAWAAAVALICGVAGPAAPLDVFTLWRQPELPLALRAGAWADYRTQTMAGGRREEGAVRAVCLGRGDDDAWIFELLPLEEADDGSLRPIAGEGTRLELEGRVTERKGELFDAVRRAVRWTAGRPEDLDPRSLREDPLVAASLDSAFEPDATEEKGATTRIVAGRELSCRQLVMTAADTQSVELPAGTMIQTTLREVTAAVHPDVPFLGLVYASERVRDESRLDPPSRRLRPPAPRVTVEVMELVGFGDGASATLGTGD